MPANDVVRHDLNTTAQFDFEGEIEPMPMPLVSQPADFAPAAPPITTEINVPEINAAPYRSIGQMVLSYQPRRTLGASGWVVAPRAFITAGHCVYEEDRGGWIIKASFCPRFNSDCPGKTYTVEAAFTLQGWLDHFIESDHIYDLAVCLVTEPFDATEPPLPFVVNAAAASQYAAIGYPGTPIPGFKFNQKRMWQALGNLALVDQVLWAENNLTTGASGGPWCAPNENWVVRGLTAGRITPSPNLAVSPIFSEGFQNLYDTVKDL